MQPSLTPSARRCAIWIIALAASTGAWAQASGADRGREMAGELQKRFAAADVNHDGLLSREEAKNGMPFVHRNFDAIDAARKGQVSMAQIAAFFREKAAARNAGG
jgi:hypothetical protein